MAGATVAPDLAAYRCAAARVFYRKADLAVPDEILRDLPARRRRFGATSAALVAAEAARVLGIRECRATPVAGGTLHAVFRVSGGTALRCFARTSLPDLPGPAGELLVDRLASTAAAAGGVPVAVIRHLDLTREHVPFALALLDAAPGQPATPDDAGDPARRALGRTLAALHAISAEGWGALDPTAPGPRGLHGSWRDFVLLNLDAHLGACRSDGSLRTGEADAIRSALRDAEPLLSGVTPALCHGDLATPNVLTEDAGVTAILDWEDALVGDPVFDLAGWGTFIGHHERREPLLAGYAERTPLPADFELRYWTYVVRILLAKTVHRRRFGYAATDRIPAGDRIRPAVRALAAALDRSA